MGAFLLFLAMTAFMAVAIIYQHKKQTTNELLVQNILETLCKKFSQASITIEAYVPGALIRKMHIENADVKMTYTRPVGANTLGLPHVLSGSFNGVIEVGGRKFSHFEFTIAHKREGKFPHQESLAYLITLERNGASIKHMEPVKGIIDERTLRTSMHLVRFAEIIIAIHGAP